MKSLLPELFQSTGLKTCLGAIAACALLGCGGDEVVETAPEVVEEVSNDAPPLPESEMGKGTVAKVRKFAPATNHLVAAPSTDMVGEGSSKMTYVESLQAKAENGDASSAYLLGLKHVTGEGVEQDLKKGLKWVKIAADHNNAKAQALLGRLYEDGKGVTQNSPLAYAWYLIAAKQDDPDAIERIGILGEKMSDLDMEEAERLAADFVSN